MNIKIRYLNFYGYWNEISLNYPQCLVTVTLYEVEIKNLDECINLQNIYSDTNRY